jgi:hypothetical protein
MYPVRSHDIAVTKRQRAVSHGILS